MSRLKTETMIGLKRLDNLQHCVTSVIRDGVPGDLIETGVWRRRIVDFYARRITSLCGSFEKGLVG